MSPPPADSAPAATGPPDRQILRLLERHLAADPLVDETSFEPDAYEPQVLRARLEVGQYPESIAAARLDVRWYTTGDFSIHYVETHDDTGLWECRWDRHPNPHDSRLHFHQPPTAAAVTDLSLDSVHPLEVYSTVLTAIDQRLETPWSNE